METLGNIVLEKGRGYGKLKDDLSGLEKKLKNLICKKTDIEMQVKNTERSGTKKRKREVGNWLEEVEQIEKDFSVLKERVQENGILSNVLSGVDSVAKMVARVEELAQQSQHFDGLLLDDFEKRGTPRVTEKLFGEKFDEGLKRIFQWLVTDNISNIGIYGMGGVGKTTLAKYIHNLLLELTDFNVYWITVSQEFSIKKLQEDIAKVIKLDLRGETDEDTRADVLSRALLQHSLLILDDVWEEFCLKKIGIHLGARKCRLILTTRSLELCYRMSCQREYEVRTLDTCETWELFKYTLGPMTVLSEDAEQIAKSVAKRCGGLPLGIITMAGSMKCVSDICEWRNTLEQLKAFSEGHDKMTRDVFPILEWSYSRLNNCQRQCFLYCCLYPEDKTIPREELINLFICAELMDRRSNRKEEFDQGHTILNHLIRLCMLEETTDYDGNECVRMHDLIRDMAIRITSGKNSLEITKDEPRFLVKSVEGVGYSKVVLGQIEGWREDLSAISINSCSLLQIPTDMSPNCPNLTTMLLHRGNNFTFFSKSDVESIPGSFFRHMGGLKILSLHNDFIIKLPDSISDMVNLTALLVCCPYLEYVPPLGKLNRLRTLDLSSTQINDIPQGLESLVNLEILRLGKHPRAPELVKDIPKGTLSELQTLQELQLPKLVTVSDVEVFNNLEVFSGSFSSIDLYNQSMNFGRLKDYEIEVRESSGRLFSRPFFGAKKRLLFSHCNFHGGSNVGHMCSLPKDIEQLELSHCIGLGKCLSDVFPISNISNLHVLRIEDLVEVKFLLKWSSSLRDELVASPSAPFEKLQGLQLIGLPNFGELFHWESEAAPGHLPTGTFSSLTHLCICSCNEMRKLFTMQSQRNLQNLERLVVRDCEQLEEIAADDNEVGGGGGGGSIQSTSSGATNTLILPKLANLFLNSLPQMKNICKETINCNSISLIEVFNCPKVKRLPLFLPTINGQPSLPPNTELEICGTKEWWESLVWDNPSSKNILDPCFYELCKLGVRLPR